MVKFRNIIGEFEFENDNQYKILASFRDPKHRKKFYEENMKITKQKMRGSLTKDNLIIQAVSNLDEVNKTINLLSKRLREWYELHFPEFSRKIKDHEKFAELIQKKSRKELFKEIGVKQSFGSEMGKLELKPIMRLAKQIILLYDLKKSHEGYIESVMRAHCSNVLTVAGSLIGAKLLVQAKSLEKLSRMPASTVQILGAEKALFRHMKTGAKAPKYGILFQHQIVSEAKGKGKAARVLADKISIAAKVDYFRGKYIGDKLLEEVKERLKGNK